MINKQHTDDIVINNTFAAAVAPPGAGCAHIMRCGPEKYGEEYSTV